MDFDFWEKLSDKYVEPKQITGTLKWHKMLPRIVIKLETIVFLLKEINIQEAEKLV